MSKDNQSTHRGSAQVLNSRKCAPVSAGPDPFMREHEMCDALLRTLIAHSRYATNADADRLGLVAHITLLLAHEVGERLHNMRGKDAGRAFRRALSRKGPPQ